MKKNITFLLTVLMAFTLLIGCSNSAEDTEITDQTTDVAVSEVAEEVIQITISKDHEAEIISEKEIEVEENSILMDVMKEHFDIEEDGGFIYSIDGMKAAEGEEAGWIYYVNGEMGMVGAAEYELSLGDHILFDFQPWE